MSAIVSRSPRSVLPPLMALHSQKVTFCLGILRSLHYPALRLLRYPTAASEKTHTMGSSLSEYLRLKVHPDIADRDWSRILVRGQHQRDPSLANTSNIEKNDKTFNWQRPTTSLIDEKTLQLQCFPGIDYVRHYAAITATYLSLKGRRHDHVQYTLPSPAECLEPLMSSNLSILGPVDVVVVGHVPGLGRWTYGQWEAADSNELFSWKTFMSRRGYRVAFLGCRISFWGDIAGNLVRTLRTLNGARCVLFVGKLGGLKSHHAPNHWLATGNESMLQGKMIRWRNPLMDILQQMPGVAYGVHYTLGSVLDETREWLLSMEQNLDFVDAEVGHMAKAAQEQEMDFGYLHIVSDNLARKYIHDLSDERLADVLRGRTELVQIIEHVLGKFFDHWTPQSMSLSSLNAMWKTRKRILISEPCRNHK